jgi:hypothetical protein
MDASLRERTIASLRELLGYLESEWMGLNGYIGEAGEVAARAEAIIEELESQPHWATRA